MKEKIRITNEQLDAIKAKHDETVGTPNFYKEGMLYRCASYSKNDKGNWFFTGYIWPYKEGYLKTIKGTVYLYSDDNTERFELSDKCKEFLNIA